MSNTNVTTKCAFKHIARITLWLQRKRIESHHPYTDIYRSFHKRSATAC